MKILVVGDSRNFEECKSKLGAHDYTFGDTHKDIRDVIGRQDVIFDFIIDSNPAALGLYASKAVTVFLNSTRMSLLQLARNVDGPMACTAFGFCGFPTLFNREQLEVALLDSQDESILAHTCEALKTPYLLVDDRVGMVTPRVLCMIVNEAYFTVLEGTASRADIDLAMKLGTNYPYGPFEWTARVGLKHIYELLDALYHDTRDERYRISALMKKEYLAATPPVAS